MMERAEPGQKLYTKMRLWEFPDEYVIEPTDGSPGSSLSISRLDGSVKLIDEVPNCNSVRVPKIRTIFGVVGMLKLVAGSYLVAITERESAGPYLGHLIYKITSLKTFPCDHSVKNSPLEQKKVETEFSRLLNVAERTPGLYLPRFIRDPSVNTSSLEGPPSSLLGSLTPKILVGGLELGFIRLDRFNLKIGPHKYVIEPTDGSPGSSLSISRLDGSVKLIDEVPNCNSVRVPKIRTIFGVVGMLKLVAGSYLVAITERESAGPYLGHLIYKITSLKTFPCDHSVNNSPLEQKKVETEFSRLLNVAERTPGLYFSYDTNLTLSAQRLHDLGDESKMLPLWRQAEPRFLWNNYMLEVLIDNKLDPYLLPVIQGTFQHFQAAIGKDIIDITLIARRCTRRNGTHMWRRGADADGYVANFVESEQIVQMHGYTASFVQIRGSMPFLWEQIVDLTYKPNFEVIRREEAPRVADRHFLDLRKKYGAVLAADLVNKHGGEGSLSEVFASAMQTIGNDDIRYVHFDFHKICGHIHFERLSILYDQIEDFLDKNGYLLLNEKGEKMKEQLGVVRTNCIDCLDRTNVTQSMIGRKMLETQLRRIGVFVAEETISEHPNFDENYKILWANHGDDISIQYSGTPALKGDFVRCGQRTTQGIAKDGWNALARYYLNNFVDGTTQDAIDLLHGHYIASVSRDGSTPSKSGGLESIASFPLAFSIIMTGLFFTLISLRKIRYDYWHLFFSILWASLSIGIATVVKANGRIFCNRPRLHKPRG